ncbi:MAG: hypothetical protein JO307_32740 [Bryobacterales bacterium]|nr:hypothetical protein [Bryobacterales bacterium]MBV9399013.1 hypothetical protein [Bryobacterales bacterium]
MNLAHIHLLINHFPTVGFMVGIGLFLFGLFGKSNELKEASLVVFLGIALLTVPIYVSGNAAQAVVCQAPAETPANACPNPEPGVTLAAIQEHESVALYGLIFMLATGAFAWLGLWQYRRLQHFPAWNLVIILLLTLCTFTIMSRASTLGGEIHHQEIRDIASATAPDPHPFAREVGTFVVKRTWVWPTCETLHFVGLSLLFGVAALVDLRMLGMMRSIPFAALHRILPWGILGFGLNTITGMLFFVGAPQQYTGNPVFHWKMALMMLAGINTLYFTIFDEPWVVGKDDDAPFRAKMVAATALILVVGVLYCGRMLPFLGNAF